MPPIAMGGRGVVGDDLKFFKCIVVGVELRISSVGAGPVQIETIEAEQLLAGSASMHLHCGLLVALVSADVDRADGCSGRLRNS